jgi:2-aminoethylphosphonate-pyruvate transaminase
MREREWILLNPGPANTSRSVREVLVMPDLCHREPEFCAPFPQSSNR